MKLQDVVPRLSELALSISPITRPYAKAVSMGLSLTFWAGSSIKEQLDENYPQK